MITFGAALLPSNTQLKAERVDIQDSPQEFFNKIKEDKEYAFLLESARGDSKLAEYSFVGFDPVKVLTVTRGTLELSDLETGSMESMKTSDPLREIRRLVPPNSSSGFFRFIGGAVGFISYDSVRYWERLPESSGAASETPDMQFGIFMDGVVFDHAQRESYYYTLGENRVDVVRSVVKRRYSLEALQTTAARASVSEEKFEEAVLAAKDYIAAGDIFQVVLSKRHEFEAQGDLARFYAELSRINPSPYMYFLKFGTRMVVGSSPEMLLRVEDRRLETFPIAGTRPHLDDRLENARLTTELRQDPKENAEHVMLVDLARNDVGRVAKYGSVRVPEFKTIFQFSHVQHMVSHVVGELRDGLEAYDALRALFPAGTVSGAPKVRAMEIIDELEERPRGAYAGAVGYFSFNGNADFAITIRTLVAEGRKCSVQAGAGIVADSVPEMEWRESEAKAQGLFAALEAAGEGSK